MSRRNLVLAAVVATLVAAGAFVLLSPGAAPEEGPAAQDEASAGVQGAASSPRPPAAPPGLQVAEETSAGVAAPPQPRLAPAQPGAAAAPAVVGTAPVAPAASAGSEGGPGKTGEAPAESKASANKEDIRAVILELKGQLKGCFEQGLKSNPDLEGTVKVEFVLARSPDGGAYAREGEINDSTLASPLVEACILSKIQAAKFKDLKGDGEVRVRYPFRLSSDTAAGFGGP